MEERNALENIIRDLRSEWDNLCNYMKKYYPDMEGYALYHLALLKFALKKMPPRRSELFKPFKKEIKNHL